MRLWHKDLIPALPRQQLLGQWRECCLIAKNISEKGTPNHMLVNKIMNYPLSHFHYYAGLISDEMEKRGYKCDYSRFSRWIQVKENHCKYDDLFAGWHTYRYLKQCFCNLQEKFDCGGMSREEYNRLYERYYELSWKIF